MSTETATATTNVAHGITTAMDIVVSGATPASFNFSGKPTSVTATTFTFPITIDPPPTNLNTYQVAYTPVSLSGLPFARSGTTVTVTTPSGRYFVGQPLTITGTGACNGNYKIASIANNSKSFTYTLPAAPATACTSTGTVSLDTTPITISALAITRPTSTPGTATVTIPTSNWFGLVSGRTATVDITQVGGFATNETGFLASKVTLTCKNAGCTQFTYPIDVTPIQATAASGSTMVVSVPTTVVNLTSPLSRDASGIVTVTGVPASMFANGDSSHHLGHRHAAIRRIRLHRHVQDHLHVVLHKLHLRPGPAHAHGRFGRRRVRQGRAPIAMPSSSGFAAPTTRATRRGPVAA